MHCDDIWPDPTYPLPLRRWIYWARGEAHGAFRHEVLCFAQTSCGDWVRLTTASRLGSIQASRDLTATWGGEAVDVSQLSGFTNEPPPVLRVCPECRVVSGSRSCNRRHPKRETRAVTAGELARPAQMRPYRPARAGLVLALAAALSRPL